VARWLRTSQIHRRFFQPAAIDSARKRLSKLALDRYLVKIQPNRMTEALFRLGPEGKRQLERSGVDGVRLEGAPPKQLEHLLGINDLRIAAELSGCLTYFFACWELPGNQWNHPIIPDAILSIGSRLVAVEFDRNQENLNYFLRTKISAYRRDFDGFPLDRLLIIVDRQSRMEALAKSIGRTRPAVLLTRLDLIQRADLNSLIFYETSMGKEVRLF